MARVPDVLIYGDTIRHPALRHEIPLSVPDPFLYAEIGGERHVVVGSLEISRIAELDGGLTLHPFEEFGIDELIQQGLEREEVHVQVMVRACESLGVTRALVPSDFGVELADRVRATGIVLDPDRSEFETRRRFKTEAELAGIRRAQVAANAGMRAAAELLRRAEPSGDRVLLDGESLTCERIKEAIRDATGALGASAGDDLIVSHGAQSAVGHEMGSGPIAPGEPVVIDMWPRDRASACFADMTRTFVVGEAPAELLKYHELTLEALRRSLAAVGPGIEGRELHRLSCQPYEEAGLPTQLSKQPGQVLQDGFFHSLGHGVGLEVHEAPPLGRSPGVLVAGDVVTLEPGCYRRGFGGCRLEDLVLVTEDGYEVLTDFPYDLAP
jgi:Xaa-Pro aminopeptidase